MTSNPFLDPAKDIVQGKSDSDILARWGDILRLRIEEAAEDAAMAAYLSEHQGTPVSGTMGADTEKSYARLSGTSMAGYYGDRWQGIMKGIEHAAKHAHEYVPVGRMSLGGSPGNPAADAVIMEAIKYAQSKGTIVMAGSESGEGSKAPGVSP